MMKRRRKDIATAHHVDVGVMLLEMLGPDDAEAYMDEHGVPDDVILRILNEGQPRRCELALALQ